MIVVVSTSSPVVSLAIFRENHELVYSADESLAKNASGWLLSRLSQAAPDPITGFVTDVGPGSFIGARVGITLVKMLAELHGVPCAGITAFDLISPKEPVAIPNRKSDWCLRIPGQPMVVTPEIPSDVHFYRAGNPDSVFPSSARAGQLLAQLSWQSAVDFVPVNEVPPSISQPNQPYAARVDK